MINTNAFDYINVLDKGLDATWIRNEVIANNIANATTPGYKRQDVSFEVQLQKALSGAGARDMDQHVAKLKMNELNPLPYTDYSGGYEYRLDGNNVDPETENVMLAENQLKYQGLLNAMDQEFKNLQSVMK